MTSKASRWLTGVSAGSALEKMNGLAYVEVLKKLRSGSFRIGGWMILCGQNWLWMGFLVCSAGGKAFWKHPESCQASKYRHDRSGWMEKR